MSNKNNICNLNAERNTMTVAEAARYVGVSKDLIYKMVREGGIPFVRIGKRRILFRKDSIDKWLCSQEISYDSRNEEWEG